jgi:acetyl/propionyl-CoA carboxylase alpha subunit
MIDYELRVNDAAASAVEGFSLIWLDRARGVARLSNGAMALIVVVEGSGSDWTVTLRGRRLPVTVRSWRERLLAAAEVAAAAHGGPIDVKATLPGLVVAIAAPEGTEVLEGDPLLTIEAMKMQNEVRSPRAGRVASVAVAAGQAVGTGQLLLRLE